LIFLWLPNPEAAMARVQDRVRRGGHDIPEATIRRRYVSGLRHFFSLYMPLTSSWRFSDNSGTGGPRPIARGAGSVVQTVFDPQT
jgi:predicted ABC-type ATPase